jgi:biotin carboxyl carrier protein
MQNEMPSPKDGVVVSLRVSPGEAVSTGQVMASIE